jgi:hypothetical protein
MSKIHMFPFRSAPVTTERAKHTSTNIASEQVKAYKEFMRNRCIAVSISQVACEIWLFQKRWVMDSTRWADGAYKGVVNRLSRT